MFAVSCLAEVTHYSGHGEIWRGKATFHDIFHVLIGVSVCVCVCLYRPQESANFRYFGKI